MPTARDQEERDLKITLMQTQNDLYKRQMVWEAWKALSTILAAVAVISGTVIALENDLRPASQSFVLRPGTTITTPSAR